MRVKKIFLMEGNVPTGEVSTIEQHRESGRRFICSLCKKNYESAPTLLDFVFCYNCVITGIALRDHHPETPL